MKKFFAVVLTLALICCLFAGCAKQTSTPDATSSPETSAEVTSGEVVSAEGTSSQQVNASQVASGSLVVTSTPTATSKPATTTSKPATVTSKPSTATSTKYSKPLIYYTDFSDAHPMHIASVVGSVVSTLDIDSKYCTDYDKESGIWFKYTIPEADFLAELRKTFVISDSFFSQIKQAKTYNLDGPDRCEYKNGAFYAETFDGWGGGADTALYFKKLTDDKKGTLTLYYLYLIDDIEQHYIELTYAYSGSASYTFLEDKEHNFAGDIQSTSKAFIDSLRLKSVKKAQNYPGNTEPQMKYDYLYNGTSYSFYWYEKDPTHIELFGCAGEFGITCPCGGNDSTNNWNFNAATKKVTCPCGSTVMTEVFSEKKIYR